MRKKVTLKQLAAELNLSISTVSKSLKNDPEISQATIDKVKKLAKEKKYKPNALAVSLKSNKTRSIGVIIPDILNSFFAEVLLGIEKEARENNYKIVTCISNESLSKEIEYLDMLAYNGVDGFILAVSQETQTKGAFEHFNEILKDELPIVMFDRVSDEIYCDKVIVDDKRGAKNAVELLIKKGCKKIGVVSNIHKLSVGKERIESIQNKAKDADLNIELLKLKNSDVFVEAIAEFIAKHKLDGVVGIDETSAVSSINAATKLNLQIPQEFSVVGFSNGILAKHSYPTLTTVSQHAEKIGKATAKILIDKLELRAERYLPETKVIKTTIIERNSTK